MRELPEGWEQVKLNEVCDVRKGQSITKKKAIEGGIPVIAGGQEPAYYHNAHNREGKTITVSASGAYAGFVNYFEGPIFASDCSTIQPLRLDEVDTKYVYLYLKSKQQKIYSLQAGAGQPHIYPKDLVKLSINLPPLSIQHRTVAILEKAEQVKNWHTEQSQLLDDYLKSVFLEMFGDPGTNPKGWKINKFGKLGELNRGKSKHRPRNAPELLGGSYPLIQTGEIANSGGYIRSYTQTYSEIGLKQSKMWKKGTLCITIAANIAKTGILTFDACFPDSIVGFTPDGKTNTEYIQHWMSFLQKYLEEKAPMSAQKNINLKILSDIDVPTPPIALQSKFAAIVQETEKVKAQHEESTKQADDLFNALMQKAFTGELIA